MRRSNPHPRNNKTPGFVRAPGCTSGSAPSSATGVSGGSEIYRIHPDGHPQKVWTHAQDIVYALGFDAQGKTLAGAGNKGAIYRLDTDNLYTVLLNSTPTQVTAFCAGKDGKIYASTGNAGKVFEIGAGFANEGSIESEVFEHEDPAPFLEHVNGILVPGGFGQRGAEGKIRAAQFARERDVPYFGICFGMQMAVIEAARNLVGIENANSTEFGPTPEPLVGLMTEWLRGNELEKRSKTADLGGTMRLGAYPAALKRGSRVSEVYGGATEISERHRHRYEVNTAYKDRLEQHGLKFSGLSPDGVLPEIVEYEDHPWFIGVQFHPELKSRPFEPHPLFASFIQAAMVQSRLV